MSQTEENKEVITKLKCNGNPCYHVLHACLAEEEAATQHAAAVLASLSSNPVVSKQHANPRLGVILSTVYCVCNDGCVNWSKFFAFQLFVRLGPQTSHSSDQTAGKL